METMKYAIRHKCRYGTTLSIPNVLASKIRINYTNLGGVNCIRLVSGRSGCSLETSTISASNAFQNLNVRDVFQPWHNAQQIINSGGRVFDDQGRAYKCDSFVAGSAPGVTSTSVSHEEKQISKSDSNLESIDTDGNGWPDIGLSLSAPSSQLASGVFFHNISEIKSEIDKNGNGWPDRCDYLA